MWSMSIPITGRTKTIVGIKPFCQGFMTVVQVTRNIKAPLSDEDDPAYPGNDDPADPDNDDPNGDEPGEGGGSRSGCFVQSMG